MFNCRQKINFIPHASLEILQRYANLFWVLRTCLVEHTQNHSINLYKTLMFISMQKTNLITHFFLEILHFKESCNLIGWQHQELEFRQIWDWWWNINSNISFHFRLFPRKTNDKIFLKIQKNLFWGHFGPFLPKFGQKWIFLEKRALSVCRYSNYLSSCQKSYKTIEQFLRKTPNWPTDRQTQTDRQTDRQTAKRRWFYKTLRRHVFGDYLFSTYRLQA